MTRMNKTMKQKQPKAPTPVSAWGINWNGKLMPRAVASKENFREQFMVRVVIVPLSTWREMKRKVKK